MTTETNIHSNIKIDFNSKKNWNWWWNGVKHTKKNTKINLNNDEEVSFERKESPVKIAALWGLEQVWENMMFMEYNSDIIIIDAWILMPWGEIYWVDYVIPDISYLRQRKEKVRGIIITHGHLDHIWALKHVLPDLGYPTVYWTPLAIGFIQKSLEWTEHLQKFKYQVINPDVDIVKLWVFTIEYFRVNHSIPEATGLAIHTPKGLVVHTWDFKIDFTPAIEKVADIAKIARIWQEGVKLLFSDSTNSMKTWRTPSEKTIWEALENVIKTSNSRLIIATFSSLIWRISQIIEYAAKYNKIVFLSGRSMINNVEIAKQLGYVNVPQWIIRKLNSDIESLPDDRVIILTTWSQWEEFSALVRVAKWEHPQIKVKPWDKILLSASPIVWNEMAVVNMINELIRKWADVITNHNLDLHVSWHAYQEDQKMMLSLVKPEYFIPVHGELFMRYKHKRVAEELGLNPEKVYLVDNGQFIEMYNDWVSLSNRRLKLDTVMIDGLGIGHLSWEYVMKARKIMAEDGMVSLIFKIDSKSKELVWNIQIESRWFVYSSEVKKVHTNIVDFSKKRYYELLRKKYDIKDILKDIKEELSEYLTKTVWRVPMIVPMFVYINREVLAGVEELWEEEAIVGMTLEEQGSTS